ncbi:MAG: DNA helicase PcrA [Firmicutes bacterium]|nr:DNA helicase PcrA [Bacillota bacterium]
MNDILSGLNPMQRQAVCHTDGPLLILAGAGSGKTRVLTHRIAYLIGEKGVFPGSILAVTFTNKAAREMRERVEGLVGPWSKTIWVSTFHAFCAKVLRRDIDKLGISRGFTIFDSSDQKAAMKKALDRLNLDGESFQPVAVLNEISSAKNELISPEDYTDEADGFWKKTVARLYPVYQKILRENNALDFDDLLAETVRLFREFPSVLDYYRKQFKYILVDEYQDTNRAQYELVNLLAEESRNLCVCGDPDQSIYQWRGADIRNILDFEHDYPDAKVIKLEQNYRSTQTILNIANNVISRNQSRKEKDLWTENGEGCQAICYEAYNERDEASFVAEEIEKAIIGGLSRVKYGDFAILYRTNAQSRVFEEILMSRGIPYKVVGGLKFYERKEIKDILSYLRLLLNPDDMVSLSRIVNVPKRGVGEATLAKYIDYAGERNIHLLTAFQDVNAVSGIAGKTKQALMEFGEFIEALGAKVNDRSVAEILSGLLDASGYVKALEEEKTVEAASRAENVKELLSVAKEYDARDVEGRGVAGFLEEAALIADVDLFDEDQEGVTLMTLHSAKGLEFPRVFLVGMEEGLLPHSRTLIDETGLEEERRLCYVGITRAREMLYFTFAAQRMLYGEVMMCVPSRFLEDVPENLLTAGKRCAGYGGTRTCRTRTGSVAGVVTSSDRKLESDVNRTSFVAGSRDDRKTEPYRVGDKIRSPYWGIGTVISSEGEGDKLIIRVAFPDQGIKRLLASIAPIERIT